MLCHILVQALKHKYNIAELVSVLYDIPKMKWSVKLVLAASALSLLVFSGVVSAFTSSYAFKDANNISVKINGAPNSLASLPFSKSYTSDDKSLHSYTYTGASSSAVSGTAVNAELCKLGYTTNNIPVGVNNCRVVISDKKDDFSKWLQAGLDKGTFNSSDGFTLQDLASCKMTIDYYSIKGLAEEKRAFIYAAGNKTNVCQDYGKQLLGIQVGTRSAPTQLPKIGGTAPAEVDGKLPANVDKIVNSPVQNQTIQDAQATVAAASGTDTEKLACAASMKGGVGAVLKWFACPIVDGMISLAATTDNIINDLLTIDTSSIFGEKNGKSYQAIWANFRNLSAGLIVIAALVMVLSQVMGLEIMSAYTVRKVLPRLLFAAVFIASSWAVLGFLIGLSNDLGTGIRSLFYGPFVANGTPSLSFGTALLLQIFGFGAGAVAVGVGLISFGWMGLALFALTGVLAAFIAFAVLILRELLVTVLVVMAPLAIAASILPNTQKFWTMWKGALTSVLVVFPIISAMIAAGHVLAFISVTGGSSSIAKQVVGFVAYFAPYFLLPMAFKMAGGLIGTVTGMVNDRSKGVFDRLRNGRQAIAKNNMENFKYGQRFRNNSGLGGKLNSIGSGVGAFGASKDKWGYLTDKNVRGQSNVLHSDYAAARYGDTVGAKMAKENDGINQALTYSSAAHAKANMARDWNMNDAQVETAIAGARAAGGFGKAQQVNALRTLADTGTGYGNLKQLHESVARVHGDDTSGASSTLGYINYVAGKNRIDLKTGYGKQMELYKKTLEHEKGAVSDEQYEQSINEGYIAAVKGNDIVSLVRSKPAAVKNTAPALKIALKDALSRGDTTEAATLTGVINQVEQISTMYASPEIATISTTQLAAPTIGARKETINRLVNKDTPPSKYNVDTQADAKQKRQDGGYAYSAVTPSYQVGAPIPNAGDLARNIKQQDLREEQRVNSLGVPYNPNNINDLNNPANPNSPLNKR